QLFHLNSPLLNISRRTLSRFSALDISRRLFVPGFSFGQPNVSSSFRISGVTDCLISSRASTIFWRAFPDFSASRVMSLSHSGSMSFPFNHLSLRRGVFSVPFVDNTGVYSLISLMRGIGGLAPPCKYKKNNLLVIRGCPSQRKLRIRISENPLLPRLVPHRIIEPELFLASVASDSQDHQLVGLQKIRPCSVPSLITAFSTCRVGKFLNAGLGHRAMLHESGDNPLLKLFDSPALINRPQFLSQHQLVLCPRPRFLDERLGDAMFGSHNDTDEQVTLEVGLDT